MLMLEAAHYRPFPAGLSIEPKGRLDPERVHQVLGEAISEQIEITRGTVVPDNLGLNMIASTMLDLPLANRWMTWSKLRRSIEHGTVAVPTGFVNAYECATWGYLLRYAIARAAGKTHVLMTIVDVNVLDLTMWYQNENWGKSGFGIMSLLFRLPSRESTLENDTPSVTTAVARSGSAVGEFVVELRKLLSAEKNAILSGPFFSPSIYAMFDRVLPTDRLLPNLHDVYGHCFGSDPWLGLIVAAQSANHSIDQSTFLAASVALNGYWAIAPVQVAATARLSLLEPVGEMEEMVT